jgi:dGTPase
MDWEKLLNSDRPGEKRSEIKAGRSPFEQDYDRIVFSYPFRSLQDKTQVFPLPKHDFVHTRLTHSLEVASVGRSLGKLSGQVICQRNPELADLRIYPDDFGHIVSAACLMHDIGNPPFGHAGENAISQFFRQSETGKQLQTSISEKKHADLLDFEGNAQGFRLVNKNNFQGLRLTFATLGAFTKYPRGSTMDSIDPQRKSQKKYGFFQSNAEVFTAMVDSTGMLPLGKKDSQAWCRHPLAFLVEAADDICYSIIDLEDGCNLGLVDFKIVQDLMAKIIGKRYKPEKLNQIASSREKIGILRALTIKELIDQSVRIFVENETGLLSGQFDTALTDLIPASETLGEIQSISFNKIYKSEPVLQREIAGFEVLQGLLEAFTEPVLIHATAKAKMTWRQSSLIRMLPEDIRLDLGDVHGDAYEAVLCLLDFISGLTDSHALALFRNIRGISLPGVG